MQLFAQGLHSSMSPPGQFIQVANATGEPIRVQLEYEKTHAEQRKTSLCGAVAAGASAGALSVKLEGQASVEVEEKLKHEKVRSGSRRVASYTIFYKRLSGCATYLSITDEHGTDQILGPERVDDAGESFIVIVDSEGKKAPIHAPDPSKPFRDGRGLFHGKHGCPTCRQRSPNQCHCPEIPAIPAIREIPEETLADRLWRTIFGSQTCCGGRATPSS